MFKYIFFLVGSFLSVTYAQAVLALCDEVLTQSNGSSTERVFRMPASAEERQFYFSFNAHQIPDQVKIELDGVVLGSVWVGGECENYTGQGETLETCLTGPLLWRQNNQNTIVHTLEFLESENLLDENGFPEGYEVTWHEDQPVGSMFIDLKIPKGPCQELKFYFISNPNQQTGWNGKLECTSHGCPSQDSFNVQAQVQENPAACGTAVSVCGATSTEWTLPSGQVISNNSFVAHESGTYNLSVNFLSCPSLSGEVEINAGSNMIGEIENIHFNSPVCKGGILKMSTPHIEGLDNVENIRWMGPLGFIGNGDLVQVNNFNESHVGTYKAVAYNEEGCFVEGEFDVEMIQQQASSSLAGVACEGGGPISLNSQAEIGFIDPVRYKWIGPNGVSSNESSVVLDPSQYEYAGNYRIVISDDYGCRYESSHTLLDYDFALETQTDRTSPCEDNGVAAVNIVGGQGPYDIFWSSTSGDDIENQHNSEIKNLPKGRYDVEVVDDRGCIKRAEAWVLEDELRLSVNAPSVCDPLSNPKYEITLIDQDNKIVISDNSQDLHFEPGVYRIEFDYEGCMYADDVQLYAWRNQELYIPNAFSPNRDGVNDVFRIYNNARLDIIIDELSIYNRWGDLIYKEENTTLKELKGWNGQIPSHRPAQAGVYAYVLKYRMHKDCDIKIKRGDVHLVD